MAFFDQDPTLRGLYKTTGNGKIPGRPEQFQQLPGHFGRGPAPLTPAHISPLGWLSREGHQFGRTAAVRSMPPGGRTEGRIC